MSAHVTSMRDALYEAPGPRTKRLTVIGTTISLALVAVGAALVVRQFYITGQLDAAYWSFFTEWNTWRYLLEGLVGTVRVALVAAVISLVLGVLLMFGRISSFPPLAVVSRVVIDFFRGVPSLLLIYFFFLVVPQYGLQLPSFWMITLPVSLAASGVLAEVFRAGVNAVPKGQTEAALSIGLTPTKTMLRIVLPQALRIVVPSLISQLVVVVKDTTVAYVVSYPDLMQNARVLITTHDSVVSVYLVVALIYILINFAINQLSIAMARRSGNPIISRETENPT
ncbi:MAG: amino acid ABC transporter permease [Atopobiaceae bacterium]|jgi:glutamate transport system permease protein|nr:amino acid ABC transporter permease [Atopobiaceae bacterium]